MHFIKEINWEAYQKIKNAITFIVDKELKGETTIEHRINPEEIYTENGFKEYVFPSEEYNSFINFEIEVFYNYITKKLQDGRNEDGTERFKNGETKLWHICKIDIDFNERISEHYLIKCTEGNDFRKIIDFGKILEVLNFDVKHYNTLTL